MARRAEDGQQGFIITLELVLIFTILGIGLLVGIVAIRNALFVWWQNKKSYTVWVADSTAPPDGPVVMGPVRDFDEHEAPRFFFIDRELTDPDGDPDQFNADPSWMGRNYRAFLGVRDDRFTTRHRIFYRNSPDCGATGNIQPCIVVAGNEDGDNLGIGTVGVEVVSGGGVVSTGTAKIANAGGIGYLYPLQRGPSYGIGRNEPAPVDPDFDPGFPGSLYRATTLTCPMAEVTSVWTSQTVTSGEPCEQLPAGVTVEAAKCPDGRNGAQVGDLCLPPADSRCVTISGGGLGTCSNVSQPCDDDTDCSVSLCSISGAICNPVDPDACAGTCNDGVTSCNTNGDCPTTGICTSPGQGNNTAGPCDTDDDCANNWTCEDTAGVCSNSQGTCQPSTGTCLTGGGGLVCACPGWDTPGTGDDWIDYGSNCCPPGTIQNVPGQCSLADNAGVVVQAVPVEVFNNIEFTYPFRVNLPPDPSQFFLIAPSGTEGVPGTVTNVPYDPSQPIDFTVPPAGEEGGPP